MNFSDKIHPEHTALVVIDVQRDYFVPGGIIDLLGYDLAPALGIIEPLRRMIDTARDRLKTIVYTRHVRLDYMRSPVLLEHFDRVGISRPYDPAMDDFYEIEPRNKEIVLEKHRYSPFMGTAFDHILRAAGVKTLILAGMAANVCVESTARDGFMMDYHIVLPEDLTAGTTPEAKDMTLDNIRSFFGEVTTSEAVIAIWDQIE